MNDLMSTTKNGVWSDDANNHFGGDAIVVATGFSMIGEASND
jgi:hypothetical protein